MGGAGGGMDREAAHVHLVDHTAVQRLARVAVVAPVEGVVHHHAARPGGGQLGGPAPRRHGTRERLGVRVEQQPLRVEAVALLRRERAADPVQVAPPGAHALHQDVPHVAGAVVLPVQSDLGHRLGDRSILEQQQ